MAVSGFRELVPHPALRPFVDRFWVRSTELGDGGAPARILPDGCIDILIDLDRGSAGAVGTMTRAVVFERGGRARIAAVRFRPGGAAPFLGVPAEDLTDRVVDTADLGLRWLAEAPFQGDDVIGGVRTLERTLLERLPGVNSHEPQIEHAISALLGPDPPSIAVLARRVGWSRQQLGRAVRRAVGVSPKRLARVARLQRATALLQAEPDPGLAAVAIRAGYFDQAHMTRDFRDLADVTPAGAAASHGSIRPIRSLLGSL